MELKGEVPILPKRIESSGVMQKMQEGAKTTLEKIKADAANNPSVQLAPLQEVVSTFFDTSFEKKAEFLPSTKLLFNAVDVDASRVNPVPLGEGLNHIVFSYASPDGRQRVVKIPRESTQGMMVGGHTDERENIDLVQKYFPQYAVPTEILTDQNTGAYVITQDVVKGTPITNKSRTKEIDMQLKDIMKANGKLMKETGHSMDFVGVPGFLSWVKHQYKKIFTRTSVFEVSNLLVGDDGKIRIVDYDMLRFKNISLKQRFISDLGYATNFYIMKWYFGVNVKGK
jgi:hypothetical protein